MTYRETKLYLCPCCFDFHRIIMENKEAPHPCHWENGFGYGCGSIMSKQLIKDREEGNLRPGESYPSCVRSVTL